MVRKNSFRPNCESLEAREVPAIMIAGVTFNNTTGNTDLPNGGTITITEFVSNGQNTFDANNNNPQATTRSATAADDITFELSNGTLKITSTDGIFGLAPNPGFLPNRFGTTVTINNVSGLDVNLNMGGDDKITISGTAGFAPKIAGGAGNDTINDNTMLGTTIDGGIGSDTINVSGGQVNPLLLQLLMQPGGLNPAFLPFIQQMSGPAKSISGGDGDDTITITGTASMFMVDGGAGADRINGPILGFFNQLKGGADNDIIVGGMGQDIIFGDAGNDILFGFGGNDFYIAIDGGLDFVLNTKGDTVIGDPLDSVAFKA